MNGKICQVVWGATFLVVQNVFFWDTTFREGGAHFGIQFLWDTFLGDTKNFFFGLHFFLDTFFLDTKFFFGDTETFFGIQKTFLGIQKLFSGYKMLFSVSKNCSKNFWLTKIPEHHTNFEILKIFFQKLFSLFEQHFDLIFFLFFHFSCF